MNTKHMLLTLCGLLLVGTMSVAQVKIGDNPGTLATGTVLDVEKSGQHVVVSTAGNLGIGTTTPGNKLEIAATANPIKATGLQAGAASDLLVSTDAAGVFHTLTASKPQIASVKLGAAVNIARGVIGNSYHFPSSTQIANTIPGASIATNGDITVPAGTYQVTVTVDAAAASDATPPAAGFYMHSYFYDFLTAAGFSRIHQNTPSNTGGASNHGVSITYTTTITATTTFPFNIGWGQGGNAATSCNLTFSNGCQLSITKVL